MKNKKEFKQLKQEKFIELTKEDLDKVKGGTDTLVEEDSRFGLVGNAYLLGYAWTG